ncbi:hypothetical protein Glove_198g85 [Diversispora epigaea]|uniref:Uncharacterized protein n=1 Tax=Diversispora epigaea TaxID=1348612 RepID=A0A397IUP4_9GLOM|nr:hypothetical protein Glove_198g85 [Diversispora epigaea]
MEILHGEELVEYYKMTNINPDETPAMNTIYYEDGQNSYVGICYHKGIEKHWSNDYTGNKYIKSFDNNCFDKDRELHRYRLWFKNVTKRIERAREVDREIRTRKEIRAINIIKPKLIEFLYRPNGRIAKRLAMHYKLLWKVREEMRQHGCTGIIDMQVKFNKEYSNLIRKLPPSLVQEAWVRLNSKKWKPISEEEASSINPIIEAFLKHEVNRYQKKLNSNEKEAINSRVKKELDSLSLQLLEFNEKTFGSFMREITKQLKERVNANNKLRNEIEQQKIKLQKAEKLLASLSINK